jgi:hypothetical protein
MQPGKLSYVPVMGNALAAHGGLMLLLGLAYCVYVPVGMFAGEEPGVLVLFGCLGVMTPLVGALQLYAGLAVKKHRHRLLAIVSALLGWYASCISLCLPASLLLAVFVTVVLIDPPVRRTFDRA